MEVKVTRTVALDLSLATLLGLVLLGIRMLVYRHTAPRLKRYLAQRQPGLEKMVTLVSEDAWELAGSVVLQLWTLWVINAQDNRCNLTTTAGCLHGWPHHGSRPAADVMYLSKLAWYVSNNLKHHVGVGSAITNDMVVHHVG